MPASWTLGLLVAVGGQTFQFSQGGRAPCSLRTAPVVSYRVSKTANKREAQDCKWKIIAAGTLPSKMLKTRSVRRWDRAFEAEARRWERNAEGVEGLGFGEGYPPPQLTRGLGSVVNSPSGVGRRAPAKILHCRAFQSMTDRRAFPALFEITEWCCGSELGQGYY